MGPSNKKNSRFPNEIEFERFHIFDAAPSQVGEFLAGESDKIVFIDQADLTPLPESAAADTAPLIQPPMNEDVEMRLLHFFDITLPEFHFYSFDMLDRYCVIPLPDCRCPVQVPFWSCSKILEKSRFHLPVA